jgi:sporadic carbohydrate cluster 2OG-Fe(II) oxygenase
MSVVTVNAVVTDKISTQMRKQGYAIFDVPDDEPLSKFHGVVTSTLGVNDLRNLHNIVSYSDINSLRLSCFAALNGIDSWDTLYSSMFKHAIDSLIGPDVAIQSKLNLSIQMPADHTSVLQMHTDTLAGQSVFELVCWLPLTNACSTNSMYVFEPSISNEILKELPRYESLGMDGLFSKYRDMANFLTVSYGQALVFSPTLFHGNVLNESGSTRVSVNCRVKNVFSPESRTGERRLGSFYKLLRLSPLSELALSYRDDLVCF